MLIGYRFILSHPCYWLFFSPCSANGQNHKCCISFVCVRVWVVPVVHGTDVLVVQGHRVSGRLKQRKSLTWFIQILKKQVTQWQRPRSIAWQAALKRTVVRLIPVQHVFSQTNTWNGSIRIHIGSRSASDLSNGKTRFVSSFQRNLSHVSYSNPDSGSRINIRSTPETFNRV